jgi:hypothetical protein
LSVAAAIAVSVCVTFAGVVHDDMWKDLGYYCSVALLSCGCRIVEQRWCGLWACARRLCDCGSGGVCTVLQEQVNGAVCVVECCGYISSGGDVQVSA